MTQLLNDNKDFDGVLAPIEFCGHIENDGKSFPLKFQVKASRDWRLVIDSVDVNCYIAATRQQGTNGRLMPEMKLTGVGPCGEKFDSDRVAMRVRCGYCQNSRGSVAPSPVQILKNTCYHKAHEQAHIH